jgi:polysaccharide pyruvyl transferase WcaK-like protein
VINLRPVRKKRKIFFFGNFGTGNFGNEATLQAIHVNSRRLLSDAEFTCICTYPMAATAIHNIRALPIRRSAITVWTPKNRVARWVRTVVLGIPSELYRWWRVFGALKDADALVIPGTGLLTDASGLLHWGPYGLFQWVMAAKLCRCRVLFMSIGAGPLYGRRGRLLAKAALGLADYRSYRDSSSREYLRSVGFSSKNDRVYPDLVFSLPQFTNAKEAPISRRARRIIGLGLMHHDEMYGDRKPDTTAYQMYLDCLVRFASWALAHDYDITLLIGERSDPMVDFMNLLNRRLSPYDSSRINSDKITCVDDLLIRIADTHIVVATRFHNLLFALLEIKPTIAISFHSKCTSLMETMGLSEYCLQINRLSYEDVVRLVLDVEEGYDRIKSGIAARNLGMRNALEQQYSVMLQTLENRPGVRPHH